MNRMNLKMWGKRALFMVGALIFAALAALIFGWLLMLLWNWLMPQIFGLPLITYWQGWGLILLSHLLFKGGGHGGYGHSPRSRRDGFSRGRGHGDGYRRKGYVPEEFDEFKREFHHRMRQKWHNGDHDPDKGDESSERRPER
jgi:hypothetical protein